MFAWLQKLLEPEVRECSCGSTQSLHVDALAGDYWLCDACKKVDYD